MRPTRGGTAALVASAAAALGTRAWLATRPLEWSFSGLDLAHFFLPAHAWVGDQLAAGRLPRWNPWLGFGASPLEEIQVGLFYPPNLLVALVPAGVAIEILAALHAVLGAAGAVLLARAAGLAAGSAAVAGVALGTGLVLHFLASWPPILATFAWAPVAFAAACRLGDAPGPRRAAGLALVLGLQALAGYPQLHLYTAACAPLFALGRGRPVRTLAWLAVAEALALGLAAVALAPAMAAVPGSIRSREALEPWFYEIFPVRASSWAGGLRAPGWDARAAVWLGAVAPCLALAGAVVPGVPARLRWPALLLLVVAVVLSLGRATPVMPLLWRLPVSHWLTGPYKWTYLGALALAVLAGGGTAALARAVGRRAPRAGRAVAWVAALAVAATALAGYRTRAARPPDFVELFARWRPAYRWIAPRTDTGRTFVHVPRLAASLRQGEIERVRQVNTYETFVQTRLFDWLGAVTRAADAHEPRALALLRALGVRFVLTPGGAGDWLAAAGLVRGFASPTADVWEDPAALPRAYVAAAVRVVPAAGALEALGDPALAAGRAALLEAEDGPPGAAGVAGGTVRVADDAGTVVRLAVDVPAPAVVVLLDAWGPWWRADVDGARVPIRRANLLGRAVVVPAGAHVVTFRFVPWSFRLGAAASAGALLVVVALLARRRQAPRQAASASAATA